MQDFRNLKVWQKAHELALMAYRLTANFPREETFGLMVAHDLELMNPASHELFSGSIVEVKKMLGGFRKTLA